MPYYDEFSSSLATPRLIDGVVKDQSLAQWSYQRTYRSRDPKSDYWYPVADTVADPYAGFLTSLSEARSLAKGHRTFVRDTGHPWWKEQHSISGILNVSQTAKGSYPPATYNHSYRGWYVVRRHAAAQPALAFWAGTGNSFVPKWPNDLAAQAQVAISRRAPQPHIFEMSQFLGELREGLPSLVGAALLKGRVKDIMKNAGSEYLNVQFGWLPLVSELRGLVSLVTNLDKVLSSQRDKQGKPQEAVLTLPPEIHSDSQTWTALEVALGSQLKRGDGNYPLPSVVRHPDGSTSVAFSASNAYQLRTLERRRRFVGCFTSYFDYPPVDSSFLEKARSLMNVELTPTVLWELAPWSWLVDWVFHIQSTIESNLVASNKSVVMNYGYMTEKVTARQVLTGSLKSATQWDFNGRKDLPFSTVLVDSYIRRIRANPFGFQVTSPAGFNPQQLAILAALGLTKR